MLKQIGIKASVVNLSVAQIVQQFQYLFQTARQAISILGVLLSTGVNDVKIADASNKVAMLSCDNTSAASSITDSAKTVSSLSDISKFQYGKHKQLFNKHMQFKDKVTKFMTEVYTQEKNVMIDCI